MNKEDPTISAAKQAQTVVTRDDIIRKLTSRKFLIALITAITGIVTLFIGDSEIIQTLAGAAMTIVPAVVYCVMEGKVDAKRAAQITNAAADAAEKLGAGEKVVEAIENVGETVEVLTGENAKDEENEME